MKVEKKIIYLTPGDSIELDNNDLISNCDKDCEKVEVEIADYYDDDDEEQPHRYNIKVNHKGVLVQYWSSYYEFISREKLKEIVEALSL